ncbi:MAG: hypothetical protein AAGI72_15380 [Pseudomonadota bacterium]
MTETYGHKFTSAYGVEPNESWAACLVELGDEQIKNGLTALLSREDPWPPTAVEFRNLCLNHEPSSGVDWEHERIRQADRAGQELLALPRPPRDPEVSQRGIASLREQLA